MLDNSSRLHKSLRRSSFGNPSDANTLSINRRSSPLELVNEICDLAIHLTDEGIANMSWSEFVEAIEAPELIQYLKERRLYINEELYVTGSLRNFADYTNIDTNKRLLIIDIQEMGEVLKAVGLQIVLEFLWQRVVENKKKGSTKGV